MPSAMRLIRSARIAIVIVAALAMAACANKPNEFGGGFGGAAALPQSRNPITYPFTAAVCRFNRGATLPPPTRRPAADFIRPRTH